MNDEYSNRPSRRLFDLGLDTLSRFPSTPRHTLADIARGIGLSQSPPAHAARGLTANAMAGALRTPPVLSPGALGTLLYAPQISSPQPGALKANKQAHDGLLRVLMNVLTRTGTNFDIFRADLEGWSRPERIFWKSTGDGHIPDASAWLGYTRYIFEVETADTIGIEHTRKQCELFAAYAQQNNGCFVMFVPTGHEVRAKQQLAAWRIRGDVW